MEQPVHNLSSLFDQLGLEHNDQAIDDFISLHRPLPAGMRLHEADFWNASQAAFLQEAVEEDADWAAVVNSLDAMLR